MLEVLRQDYVRTAQAKGLSGRVIIARHVFRNAMIPVVTIFGFILAGLVAGNVVLESLACGTPALVTDLGGPSEIVHHNETGRILPAGDERRWSEAVTELLVDGELRATSDRALAFE